MILDETRERFLKAIAKQVDPARIAEAHFFAPIRQGGVESGVAVIAATKREIEAPLPSETSEAASVVDEESPYSDEAGAVVDEPPILEEADGEAVVAEQDLLEETSVSDDVTTDLVADLDWVTSPELASDVESNSPAAEAPAPIERHVIYTAAYRLTLKGPDRGKWDTNVTAEADAPIITVDAVVRGVQRRSGDVDEPTRMTGDEIRTALPRGIEGLPTRA